MALLFGLKNVKIYYQRLTGFDILRFELEI